MNAKIQRHSIYSGSLPVLLFPAVLFCNLSTVSPLAADPANFSNFNNVESFNELLRTKKIRIEDIASPHWKKNACIACHKTDNRKASASNLRHKPVNKICNNCHSDEYDHSYIHPWNIQPDKKMIAGMPAEMKASLKKNHNRINCDTCHELVLQCLPDKSRQRLSNPQFLRLEPHRARSDLCFVCHDRNAYQKLNPHEQIDHKGRIKKEKCRICHIDSVKTLRQASNINQLKFYAGKNLASMCWGCHPWTPHPGGQFSFYRKKSGPDHMVKPSKDIKKTLNDMMHKNKIDFPLEPTTGKIFCATCHNVHQKGIIKNSAKAKGADSKNKLRSQKICQYCHYK
ncbi:MAG TPA: hypothetical protein ENJ08_18450 [Gammaproteobacteria bacterium]|nr:hypothetical protein [Gammaproteobacteria bacterium]